MTEVAVVFLSPSRQIPVQCPDYAAIASFQSLSSSSYDPKLHSVATGNITG
jgi:hypothetical protein